MHTHLMSMYKKITAIIVLILFSFILLVPTSNALPYDPKKRKTIISPDDGDTDPWNDLKVYEPPPPNDFVILTMLTIFILEKYDYFQYEQKVDINNRKIIQKQRDERIISKTQNRRFSN